MAATQCSNIQAAVTAQCAGQLDACVPPPCAVPPPLACNLETWRCGNDIGGGPAR